MPLLPLNSPSPNRTFLTLYTLCPALHSPTPCALKVLAADETQAQALRGLRYWRLSTQAHPPSKPVARTPTGIPCPQTHPPYTWPPFASRSHLTHPPSCPHTPQRGLVRGHGLCRSVCQARCQRAPAEHSSLLRASGCRCAGTDDTTLATYPTCTRTHGFTLISFHTYMMTLLGPRGECTGGVPWRSPYSLWTPRRLESSLQCVSARTQLPWGPAVSRRGRAVHRGMG